MNMGLSVSRAVSVGRDRIAVAVIINAVETVGEIVIGTPPDLNTKNVDGNPAVWLVWLGFGPVFLSCPVALSTCHLSMLAWLLRVYC